MDTTYTPYYRIKYETFKPYYRTNKPKQTKEDVEKYFENKTRQK